MIGRSRFRCHHHSLRTRPSLVSSGVQKTLPSSYPARQFSGTSSDAEDSSGSGSSSEWDENYLINDRSSLETLIRVGMGIGRNRRVPPDTTTSREYLVRSRFAIATYPSIGVIFGFGSKYIYKCIQFIYPYDCGIGSMFFAIILYLEFRT